MTTLSELKELCEKATPGPWLYNSSTNGISDKNDILNICTVRGYENRKFIAATDPETVLKLIETIEKLESDLVQLKAIEDGEIMEGYTEATSPKVLVNRAVYDDIRFTASQALEWVKEKWA